MWIFYFRPLRMRASTKAPSEHHSRHGARSGLFCQPQSETHSRHDARSTRFARSTLCVFCEIRPMRRPSDSTNPRFHVSQRGTGGWWSPRVGIAHDRVVLGCRGGDVVITEDDLRSWTSRRGWAIGEDGDRRKISDALRLAHTSERERGHCVVSPRTMVSLASCRGSFSAVEALKHFADELMYGLGVSGDC